MGHVGSPGSSAPRFASSAATMHRAWYLCPHGVVTAGSDGDAVEVVETRGAVASVDGRRVHWARTFRGERFSLIWYTTE